MDEQLLTEKLIGYDTSEPEGIKQCAGFVKGWLDARDIHTRQIDCRDLPVTLAEVGPADAEATLLLHGHIDVVPGRPEQFEPRVEGDRLIGRGAYDMKGALAAMLLAVADLREQSRVRVRLGVVPDEESEEDAERGGDLLVSEGFLGDFVITGEPTDMHVGVAAKGVVAMRLRVDGRAAHGATPWLGENAILRALDVFRAIQSLPFASRSSELFDRPSINLGRILGGDALNKVPDTCYIDVDVRYLPEQDPDAILAEVGGIQRRDDHLHVPATAGDGRPRVALRPRPLRRRGSPPRRRGDQRRPRWRFGRGVVPARRRPRGRVRSARRRPPRARRVGFGELPGALPRRAGRLRQRPAVAARRARATGGRPMRPEDETPATGPPDDATDGEGGEHAPPPPATWAGRRRAAGDAQPPDETPSEETADEPVTEEPAERADEVGSGRGEDVPGDLTEEFDEIERGLAEELAKLEAPEAGAPEADGPDAVDREDQEDEEDEEDQEDEEDELDADADGESEPGSPPTVEAETLAVADREEAREAALAGLRARAEQHEIDRGAAPPPPADSAATSAETTPPEPEPEPVAVAEDDGGKPPRAKPLWARFLAASLLIVVSMAAATSISLLVYLTDIAKGLGDNDKLAPLRSQLADAEGGAPQTILILGSDKRLGTRGDPGRSDTTILLRVDPDKDADRVAFDPARPEGQHPDDRDREVQRGLRRRRPGARPSRRSSS